MTKVAILLPTLGGFTEETTISLCALQTYSMYKGIETSMINESVTGVAKCRNALVQEALKGDYTHTLWIDSDMYFPHTILEDLLKRDKDIVGVPYVGRAHPAFLLGCPANKEDELRTSGCVAAKTMPGGLMLVRIDVYRNMSEPWYYEAYGYKGNVQLQFRQVLRDAFADPVPSTVIDELLRNKTLKDWLMSDHGEYGLTKERSEDINFVFKAARYGYNTWSDLDIAPSCYHIGKYAYGIRDLVNRVAEDGKRLDSGSDQA
jgi:hypothetical protein